MERIAVVEGVRTPFVKAWTLFEDIPAQRLGAVCTRELIERTRLDPGRVDEVIFGAVAQPVEASNVARVISLYAGIPDSVRAYTVSRNCASGFESVTGACEKIQCGVDEIVIAGGTESMSNMPLIFGKDATKIFTRLSRAKNLMGRLKLFSRFRPSHFKPVAALMLGLTDSVCGLNMGQTAEVLAKEFGISRREQDEFALASHKKAALARAKLKEEIVPVGIPPKFKDIVDQDNGVRDDQTMEQLSGLKPFFDRHTGTVTVGNSSQITDGACALLIMKEERAKQMGYKPLGYVRAYAYAGLDPRTMGLGPSYAIPVALKKAGLGLGQIELVEINEAFAVQVLASLRLLASKQFAGQNGFSGDVTGEIPADRLNVNGGAIALGHPVGTTGSRMILTLLKEMKRRNNRFGLAALCVGGGQGGAVVLER